jgi:alanine racemase
MIKFSDLAKITSGKFLGTKHEEVISELLTDSRKAIVRPGAIFFCIAGDHHDGHNFVPSLYKRGVKLFVIEREIDSNLFPDAGFVIVKSSVQALQALAAYHRSRFSIRVIGVTGSNGKTIVKEWLNQLLSNEYSVVKSPASYNSQIGVPLSLWQMQQHHQLGIFEAGISKPGEMGRIEKLIRPSIGIFTNIGSAHDENFVSLQEKIEEKVKLFARCDVIIYCNDHERIRETITNNNVRTISWGFSKSADFVISREGQSYMVTSKSNQFELQLPFSDRASIENAFHCIITMLHLGYEPGVISNRVNQLKP